MKYACSPAWSMAGRYRAQEQDQKPGPAAYLTEKQAIKTTPTWKIGSAHRTDMIGGKGIPGPGSYNPDTKHHVISGSKFYPHTNQSKQRLDTSTPGPGQYNPNKNKLKKSSNAYYMAGKYKTLDRSGEIPGPGAYDAFRTSLNRNSGKIGNSKRLANYNSEVPGPGCTKQYYSAYDLGRPVSAGTAPRVVFSREDRMRRKDVDISHLGPGQYNYDFSQFSKPEHRGYSISGRYEMKSSDAIPGPGAYSPTAVDKPHYPAATMGLRTQIRDFQPKETPGPGHYLKTEVPSSGSRYVKIGTQPRKPLLEGGDTPGPAAYSIVLKTEGPKYSMHGAKEIKSSQKMPGPSEYNPRIDYIKNRPTSAKIGESRRDDMKATAAPGPGAYNPYGSLEGPKWGFGRSLRNQTQTSGVPGPGQYQIPTTIAAQPSYAANKSITSKYMSK